ncbi:lipoprotein [uncultured Fusobacterium sp.]|uniref:lipoprotein n=1 Tax=uncultured Fusobacterium sp. TaxID=159267 RepID=UPI0025E3497C|nr:lipoprotein [uncultured Fusobacterium sp.]
MRRIFIFIIFVLLLTGCSNLVTKKEILPEEKESLVILIEEIKQELKEGKTQLLISSFIPNIRNNFTQEKIKKIDFSKVNILVSKPSFFQDKAQNIVAFNVQGTTFYYDLEYILKNGEWKIANFKERRD